jgi:hypothetical protein
MDWEMHLYVERKAGEDWVPVCPPLPSSPKARPRWGRYSPTEPVEALAASFGGPDFVPTAAPRWDFGYHPVGMQQLASFFTYTWNPNATREEELAGRMAAFLEPCGIPGSASRQVRAAGVACQLEQSNAIWYTLRELNNHIFLHRQDPDNLPDKRVIALREAMAKSVAAAYPDVCDCKRANCFHRDQLVRAVVWSAKVKKPKREV